MVTVFSLEYFLCKKAQLSKLQRILIFLAGKKNLQFTEYFPSIFPVAIEVVDILEKLQLKLKPSSSWHCKNYFDTVKYSNKIQ